MVIVMPASVGSFFLACKALVNNFDMASIYFYSFGLHQPSALMSPISWENVYVLTPQTFWAMVGIAVTKNSDATVIAHKMLYIFLKLL